MLVLATSPAPAPARFGGSVKLSGAVFPPFLPKEVERIVDPSARELAKRIQRVPVKDIITKQCIDSGRNCEGLYILDQRAHHALSNVFLPSPRIFNNNINVLDTFPQLTF